MNNNNNNFKRQCKYDIKNMNHLSFELKRALKENRFKKVVPLNYNNGGTNYIVGQWYWSGYHQMAFKVIDKKLKNYNGKKRLKSVTVLWEDGKKTTHCTSLDPRYDYKLYK